jgi:hypothetical protein
MNIEMNRADPDLPYFSVNQDLLDNKDYSNHGHNGNTNMNKHDDDKDGGNIKRTTIEAHIDLAKIAYKYYITQSC